MNPAPPELGWCSTQNSCEAEAMGDRSRVSAPQAEPPSGVAHPTITRPRGRCSDPPLRTGSEPLTLPNYLQYVPQLPGQVRPCPPSFAGTSSSRAFANLRTVSIRTRRKGVSRFPLFPALPQPRHDVRGQRFRLRLLACGGKKGKRAAWGPAAASAESGRPPQPVVVWFRGGDVAGAALPTKPPLLVDCLPPRQS
jgi:hypothetical protein